MTVMTEKIIRPDLIVHVTKDKYPCECGFPRYDCELCHDTLIVTEIHGEGASEWEEDYRCPKCDPYDMNEGLWTPNKPY